MQTFSGKKLEDRWDGARIDYDGLYPDLEKIVEILKIKTLEVIFIFKNQGKCI